MINISQLVDSQLPDFFRQEYPIFVDFFKEYYKSQELDGFSSNVLRKIQSYQDSDFYRDGLILETTLSADITASSSELQLSQTIGASEEPIYKKFPKEGLLLLDDGVNREVVQYKEIVATSSYGAVRKLKRSSSGRVKLGDLLNDGEFITEDASAFSAGTKVTNISHLFLANLFKSLKSQYFSGIPIERLNSDISVPTILKYIKDFYTSKGTSPAIGFLFRSAFNDEKVLVRYPNEQLLKSSVSTWSEDTIIQGSLIKFNKGVTADDLPGLVLKQITYGFDDTIQEATASIEKVVPIKSGNETIYRVFLNNESIIGNFLPTNQTISRTTFGPNNKSIIVDSTVGFPEINGEFYIEGINDVNGDPISFSYKEKTASEFYGVRTSLAFTGVSKNKFLYGSNILYVVSSTETNPLQETFFASFRPSGLIQNIDIENAGLYAKVGDILELGTSGKSQDTPLTSYWRQNIPGNDNQVKQVNVSGQMNNGYLTSGYQVASGVNQVFENAEAVYVSSNGFPDVSGSIGNINASGPNTDLEPASQRHLKKIPKAPRFGEKKVNLPDDSTIALSVDGVPIVSPTGTGTSTSDKQLVEQGDIQSIEVTNGGSGYSSPPIVSIDGIGGASGTANISGGKVLSITLQNSGAAYNTTPNVTISAGSGAIFNAVFLADDKTGSIDSLQRVSGGKDYTQVPDIIVVDESGRGRGAKFVVESIDPSNNGIINVKKVAGGYDYDTTKTKIFIVPSASGAAATANIRKWHRDNYDEYSKFSDSQNGYVFNGLIPEYHDAYYYVGNPVGIRNTLSDNINGSIESQGNLVHSPIIGWSYDGVPIYGPVGYTNAFDVTSPLKRVRSSYYLKSGRIQGTGPAVGQYALGAFVEDYEYKPEGDPLHKDLDEYNGRFCKTPEFPDGRYCYFTTIHQSDDVRKNDGQSVKPRYPYIIGPSFRYSPETINFGARSTLRNLPSDVIRIRDDNTNIPQFGTIVNAEVTNVSSGSIESVVIENGGVNYQSQSLNYYVTPKYGVGDKLYVDDTNTQGAGFSGQVSSIIPKDSSGNVVGVSSIVSEDIIGFIDSRSQIMTIPSPTYDVGTSTLTYNKINDGDTIIDTSIISYDLITAIKISVEDTDLIFKDDNISNISIGDTLEIEDEIVFVDGATTNSTRYVYLSIPSISATDPIGPETDQGFFYRYRAGKEISDSLYTDISGTVVKIANIIGIDYESNILKVEMITQPGTSNRYPIPTIGTSITNAPAGSPSYSQNISAISYAKIIPVIRGFDGTGQYSHEAATRVTSQIPTGKISEYITRVYITSAEMDTFTPGVYIKGANSDASAKIVRVESLTSTSGYLWVNQVSEGPDASDLPKFGTFNSGTGDFGSETINEIGSGNQTALLSDVSTSASTITVVNPDFFPINRYISIGTEKMRIVSKTRNILTVSRAQSGTLADTHTTGDNVSVVNAQGTFTSDVYYVSVDLSNAQKFTTSSTFKDAKEQTIDVDTVENISIGSDITSIYLKPNNIDFFNVGNIFNVGNEEIRIDSIDANLFGVTRAFNNTSASIHAENAVITNLSELVATLATDRAHNLIKGDFVEVIGDPSSDAANTLIGVTFIGQSNRFGFTSVHTIGIEQNPNISFVYGHNYIFDVSDSTNSNTILSFYLDDTYANNLSIERTGTPGNAGAIVKVKITDRSIVNLYYNNSNSLITDSSPKIRFIEDPYNVGGVNIFDVQTSSFNYIIRNNVEGNARGTKRFGVVSANALGEIARISITNRGFGYQSLPQIKGVYYRNSDRIRYDVVTNTLGEITAVVVNYGGDRFINPTIIITGTGSGAVLLPEISASGTINKITVKNGGSGYGSDTELLLVEQSPDNVRILPASTTIGKVLGIKISNPGSRFTNNPTLVPETTIPVSMQLINVGKDANGSFQSYIGTKYEKGEKVYQGTINSPTAAGTVIDYDELNQILRINPVVGTFIVDKPIFGYLTATRSIPKTVNTPSLSAAVAAITQISGLFSDDLGKLSTSSQKIQDSYFYQDFSYVIRSQIPVSEWREIIKESTHPAGFLVFGEVIVDSSASVSTVPLGGSTTCPPFQHRFNFDSRTEVDSVTGEIFIRNGQNIEVGDSFRYYKEGDFDIQWQASNAIGETITGTLIKDRIYYVVSVRDDIGGTYIRISEYHPKDNFADAAHNRELLTYKIIPTSISYFPEIICDVQNPYKQITIEIYKEFIDIDSTTPAKIAENGNLKTLIINKFFRMVEKRGAGSLVSAEGTVAIEVSYIDDITTLFDNVNKTYDIREQGSPIKPYSDYNMIVTLDGVAQEPGVSYTIINDNKIQSLQISSANAGQLEFDSWYISGASVDIDDGSTTVSGQADTQETYIDKEFIYIKGRGIPSYQASFGPYTGSTPIFSDYIKRIPKETFAPIDKEDTPLGSIGLWSNGVRIYNNQLNQSYNNQGIWITNEPGSAPLTDSYGGKSSQTGNYYHTANPIGLRRQREDNISTTGAYVENQTAHSKILGWAFDGTPIYGPYGYSDQYSAASSIKKIESSYSERTIATRNFLPDGTILQGSEVGPPIDSVEFSVLNFISFTGSTDTFISSQICTQVQSDTDDASVAGVNGLVDSYDPINRRLLLSSVNGVFSQNMWIKTPTAWVQITSTPVVYKIGYFTSDFIYTDGSGDLDEYNGRFCVTPEFPNGRYCYFATIKSSTYDYSVGSPEDNAAYPYVTGTKLYHKFYSENQLSKIDLEQKIIFADPPKEFVDRLTGYTQTSKFVGRLFGFSDVINNRNYSKKYVDISDQFDNSQTSFNLQYTAQQPNYAPSDPLEPNETALVFLDGVIQIPTLSYTINDATNQISFTNPPKRIGKIVNISDVSSVLNFSDNEIITGGTSNAEAKIISRTPVGYENKGVLKVELLSRDFQSGETITGTTSAQSSTIKLLGTITNPDRFLDASNLIEANKELIANEAVDIMLNYTAYSGFSVPGGTQNCVDDVRDVIDAVINNLRYGGNAFIWDAANLYATGGALQHLVGEEEQSKLVFRWAKDLCILAMQNRLGYTPTSGAGYPANPVEDRFVDAANLITSNKDFIANEAVERMLLDPNNSGFSVPGGSVNCIDDVKDVLDSMIFNMKYGGNSKIWDSANFYATTTNLAGEETESIEVFNHAKEIAIEVIQNTTVTVQGSHGLTQTLDNTITIDPGGCANVQSAITTYTSIITSTISNSAYLNGVSRTSPKAYPIQYNISTPVVSDSNIAIDGSSYTASCANVESALHTLFDIVINTITTPSSLSNITRNPGRSFIERKGQKQKFFAYSNGKYTVLDTLDTSSSTTTFIMRSNGSLIIPNQSTQIIVIIDGVIQEFGTSYVINESLLEFYKPVTPGSELHVFYWYGKDLEKILQGYNFPLYDPSYVQYDDNGDEIYYTLEDGSPTNKRLRSLPKGAYPIIEYLRDDDKIQIEGENSSRQLVDISNRDIIEWEHLDTYNDYYIDASNVAISSDYIGEPNKLYFNEYLTQSTSGFLSGTKVTYTNEGNSSIPGLTSGNTYYIGYSYRDRGVFLYSNYYDSLSAPPEQALTLGSSTGIHKFRLDTAIIGLKQSRLKTSDYSGITRGREAAFTARVRFTMSISDSTAYPAGTLVFSGGESVGTVISDLSNNQVEFQILPDRAIADGATISTDLGGSNSVTVVSKENGRIHAIESLSGFFPTGLEYDTAPILVIKPAEMDTGVFASCHAEIDENKQVARCIVDYGGRDYFQVPNVLVTRAFKIINSVYPLVITRNQYNFWTSVDTVLETVMVFEAQQFTVSSFLQGTTTVTKSGEEVTIFLERDANVDGISEDDVSRTYDYLQPFNSAYPINSALAAPNIISVGTIRAYPTFQSFENNKFNVDSTLSIGDVSSAFADLKIEQVSERYFSSLYSKYNVNSTPSTIRFNLTPVSTIRQFGGILSSAAQIGDTVLNLHGVQGFNYVIVEGNTFWLKPDMEIYQERSLIVSGYVDKIIDSDTFILRLNTGQNLTSGSPISNVANTVKVSIAAQVYGYVEFGNEVLTYSQIDWGNNRLVLSQACTIAHAQGDYLRTTQPARLEH